MKQLSLEKKSQLIAAREYPKNNKKDEKSKSLFRAENLYQAIF